MSDLTEKLMAQATKVAETAGKEVLHEGDFVLREGAGFASAGANIYVPLVGGENFPISLRWNGEKQEYYIPEED